MNENSIHYVDVGTSGGVWGKERGYCLMIGGEQKTVNRLDPVFKALAPGMGDIPRTEGCSGKLLRQNRATCTVVHQEH